MLVHLRVRCKDFRQRVDQPVSRRLRARHSAAVALAQAGMPLHLLKQRLGKNIEMTMRYARFHPDSNDVAGYFEGMGDLLGFTDSAQSEFNGQEIVGGNLPKQSTK